MNQDIQCVIYDFNDGFLFARGGIEQFLLGWKRTRLHLWSVFLSADQLMVGFFNVNLYFYSVGHVSSYKGLFWDNKNKPTSNNTDRVLFCI